MMLKIVLLFLLVMSVLSCSDDCTSSQDLVEINIKEISVKVFPNQKPDGLEWDDTSVFESEYPADISLTVSSGNELVGQSEIYFANVVSPADITFYDSYKITDMSSLLTISIWDMDEIDNQLVGSFVRSPSDLLGVSDCSQRFTLLGNGMEIEIFATFTKD